MCMCVGCVCEGGGAAPVHPENGGLVDSNPKETKTRNQYQRGCCVLGVGVGSCKHARTVAFREFV